MASVVQEWIDQGIEIGIVKGKAEGKAELLTELLEEHFGSLSNGIKEKISKADASTVGSWFSEAIKASSLDDIFKSNK